MTELKLKTLKDIEVSNSLGNFSATYALSQIKKEAIKWVKEFNLTHNYAEFELWREQFIRFHNISEEDLK